MLRDPVRETCSCWVIAVSRGICRVHRYLRASGSVATSQRGAAQGRTWASANDSTGCIPCRHVFEPEPGDFVPPGEPHLSTLLRVPDESVDRSGPTRAP